MLYNKSFKLSAPSNIAFVKYWGKYGRQYPLNPSLSLTLDKCRTHNFVEYNYNENQSHIKLEYFFDGRENKSFTERIEKFLMSISDIIPFIHKLDLKIQSHNTFPHSAGIASSASAFACLAASILQIEKEVYNIQELNLDKMSLLARLGSGSACRSIQGPIMHWGEIHDEPSTNENATLVKSIHKDFSQINNSILIVDNTTKDVGSSAGHALMNAHPYRENRIDQANENIKSILNSLRNGDWENFGEVLENEALSLHALMMSSYPSFTLLKPNSLKIIEKIRDYRKIQKLPLYFTIDAGPNIHLIYPDSIKAKAQDFIHNELGRFCHESTIIHDHYGQGVSFNE